MHVQCTCSFTTSLPRWISASTRSSMSVAATTTSPRSRVQVLTSPRRSSRARPPPLGFGSGGCSAPPAEHASPPPLVSLRLDVAQPDVRSHLLVGVPLLFRRRRGEHGARHRDEVLHGAEIPLKLAPLVGVRRRHLARVQIGRTLVQRLQVARHPEPHHVPRTVELHMQPVDLLVRSVEPSDKVAATVVMCDHGEMRSMSSRPDAAPHTGLS